MFDRQAEQVSRRDFLRDTAAAAALGVGAMSSAGAWADQQAAQSRPAEAQPILPCGKLGRAGHPVTLVSFGTIRLKGAVGTRVLQLGIDRGVNLMHTAASYGNGASVAACGDLFKEAPAYRDKVFLCVKSTEPTKESEVDELLRALHTDRADVVLPEFHSPDPRLLEAIHKQQDRLKQQGKVRYKGFVCHGDMNAVLEMVLEKDPKYFDMCLLAMKLVPKIDLDKSKIDDAGQRFMKNMQGLRKAGLGILSMKSGAQQAVSKGAEVYLPHLKAYLEAGADSVLTSLSTLEQVEMVSKLDVKSPHLTPDERKAAADFQRTQAGTCRMCAECTKVCPQRLPINDLMRFRMYHVDYGWPEHARAEYAARAIDFRRAAARCGDCSACAEVCPVKLAGPQMMRHVADMLA